MYGAAAEQVHTPWELEIEQPLETEAFLANDLEHDFEARRRLMRVLGAVAFDAAVASQEQAAAETASLAAVAKDYFSPDSEKAHNAKNRLAMDFRKNVFEILCDEGQGHISESPSVWQGDGFYQYGYSQRAIFAYGTKHANHQTERNRRSIETLNELRIEDGYKLGYSTSHYLVEISRKPVEEEMSEEDATDHGYYRTARVMFRLTEIDKAGSRNTETLAVSGVDQKGERCDDSGVAHIYQMFNLPIEDMTPTANLEAAFWAPKEALPNRSASLAQLYDEGIGGEAFCGVQGKTGNYASLPEESRVREKQVETELDNRVEKLAQALCYAPTSAQLEVMASHAKDFAAELCAAHEEYSPAQFGPTAAPLIYETRNYIQAGNYLAAQRTLEVAKEESVVVMCGMVLKSDKNKEEFKAENNLSGIFDSQGGKSESSNSSTSEDCEFESKECPVCHKKGVKTTVKKTRSGRKYVKGGCGCIKIY